MNRPTRSSLLKTTLALSACLLVAGSPTAMAQFAPMFSPRATDTPLPTPANSWRLAIHDAAESNGVISFRVWLKDEMPMHIDVPINQGDSEASIASAARTAIATRLGDRYRVAVDTGDAVVIEARKGSPDFTVELLRDTAREVEVAVAQE